jgi:hypothetical protein
LAGVLFEITLGTYFGENACVELEVRRTVIRLVRIGR